MLANHPLQRTGRERTLWRATRRCGRPLNGFTLYDGRGVPSHSMPYVCFACRRSFKRPRRFGGEGHLGDCPACHGPSFALHPHFKAPRRDDVKQWQKVQLLVENGFYFWPLYDRKNGNADVQYPASLKEAVAWVKRWKHLTDKRRGPAVV
jgi:hypothetical protein